MFCRPLRRCNWTTQLVLSGVASVVALDACRAASPGGAPQDAETVNDSGNDGHELEVVCAGVSCPSGATCQNNLSNQAAICQCPDGTEPDGVAFFYQWGGTCVPKQAVAASCLLPCMSDNDCCENPSPQGQCPAFPAGGRPHCDKFSGHCAVSVSCESDAECAKAAIVDADKPKYQCAANVFDSAPTEFFCRFRCAVDADCCAVVDGKHDCSAQDPKRPIKCAPGGRCTSTCTSDQQCQADFSVGGKPDKYRCLTQPGDPYAQCAAVCASDADCCDIADFPANPSCIPLPGPPTFQPPHCDANHRCQTTACPSDAWCKEANKASTRAKDFICY